MRRFPASSALAGLVIFATLGCSGRNQRHLHSEPFAGPVPRAARSHGDSLIDATRPVEISEDDQIAQAAVESTAEKLDQAFSAPRNATQRAGESAAPRQSAGTRGAGTSRPSAGRAMDHDPDFAWVQGKLEYSALGGGMWRVRYAPLSVEDQYGGSVVLDSTPDPDQFRSGDMVFVEGRIVKERGHRGLNNPLYHAERMSLAGE